MMGAHLAAGSCWDPAFHGDRGSLPPSPCLVLEGSSGPFPGPGVLAGRLEAGWCRRPGPTRAVAWRLQPEPDPGPAGGAGVRESSDGENLLSGGKWAEKNQTKAHTQLLRLAQILL